MQPFYERVQKIKMYDPLAFVLGASEDGVMEYCYADAVKLAGHSCPTVAGAYLMCLEALTRLYPDGLPQRGCVRITVNGRLGEGVNGVIGSVATLIAGAAGIGGFAGLGGRYDRRELLRFDESIGSDMLFERVDSGAKVGISYDPSAVKPHPDMFGLMQKVVSANAKEDEQKRFAALWQERVEKILCDEGLRGGMLSVVS